MHIINTCTNNAKRIGIWSTNRPEWTITDLACVTQGLYDVALYETLGPEIVEYVINHAELEIIVCSSNYLAQLSTFTYLIRHYFDGYCCYGSIGKAA